MRVIEATGFEPRVQLSSPSRSLASWRPGNLRPVWRKALDVPVRLPNRKELDLAAVLSDPLFFWSIFGSWRDRPIAWSEWQWAFLGDHARFRSIEKSPQIGFSWACALEAVWDALLHLDSNNAFVSVDQREASNKIIYARAAFDGLIPLLQEWVPLTKETQDELWFGEPSRPSQVMSLPNTSAMRGRDQNVYLDESDFYKDGGFTARRAAITRATRGNRVTMGSTCWGEETALDDTMRNSRNFSKAILPYTVAEDPDSIETIEIAAQEFAFDEFAEEYGCIRGGRRDETFSARLLRDCQLDDDEWVVRVPGNVSALRDDARWVREFAGHVHEAMDEGKQLVLGFDVGSSNHPSVLTLLRQDATGRWKQRCLEEIRARRLESQQELLAALLDAYPSLTAVIDVIGIGTQATETLQARYGDKRVVAMRAGTEPDKGPSMMRDQLVTEVKKALESGRLALVADVEQMREFRRTKLVRSAGGRLVVEQPGSRDARTHYDRMWATTYAWWGATAGPRRSVYQDRGLIVVGG
jgi:phage FluMu gp28-like protein